MRNRFALLLLLGLALSSCGGQASKTKAASGPEAAKNGPIAFARFVDDAQTSSGIFSMDADGTHERQLVAAVPKVLLDQPKWSPDGNHIVFAKCVDPAPCQLERVGSDGSGPTQLKPVCPAGYSECDQNGPAYSPDGTHIAYITAYGPVDENLDQIKYAELYVMNADGTNPRAVTAFPAWSGDTGGPAWSPDGKQILIARATTKAGIPPSSGALFIVNVDGTGLRQLTDWSVGADGVPAWSAAANLIVFRAVKDREIGIGNYFTIHPDGSGLTQITHLTNTVVGHRADLSPDGKWIIVAHPPAPGKQADLFIMKPDGTGSRAITSSPLWDTAPDWGTK